MERLKDRILSGRTAEAAADFGTSAEEHPLAPAAPTPLLIAEMPTAELVKLGLVSLRGILVIPLLLGLAWELDLLDRLDFEWLYERAVAETEGYPATLWVPTVAAAGLVVFVALSVAWPILRFHGYRLERVGDQLRIHCGLLTKVSATIPRRRIQFLTLRETITHRMFARVTIRVETAGGHGEETEVSRKWFVPLLPCSQASWVLQELRPGLALEQAVWQGLAPKALRRMITRGVVQVSLAGAIAAGLLGIWGLLIPAVLLPWSVIHSILWTRRAAYAVIPDGILYRSGVLTRRTTAAFFDKIQVLSLSQSPFDRRHRMATFGLDTAGAAADLFPIRIPFLEEANAWELLRNFSERTEAAEFQW